MIADYHIHTPYCGHATGKIIEYICNAIDLGMAEIGFSDHLGRYYLTKTQRRRYWDWGMKERDIARYFAELLDLKEIHEDKIAIKTGLEIDYIEGAEDMVTPLMELYPFDFFLCSIHCLPRFGWKHLSEYNNYNDKVSFYTEYFRVSRAALQSQLFESLAHLDFIWRYIDYPVSYHSQLLDEIETTVTTAAKYGRHMEINANGYFHYRTHTHKGIAPFEHMVNQIALQKVPVTLGSDAHAPTHIGKFFPEIIPFLLKKGIREITCFEEGKAVQRPLSFD